MRTPSRSMLTGALVWVGVVAVVAALVWVVITRAGAGVASDDEPGDTGGPAPVGTSSRDPSESPTEPSSTRTPTPSDPTTRVNPDRKPVQRTASGAGGTVTVSCSGAVARLIGATPTGGYGAEVEASGPGRVRVDFESEESRTRIEASCVDGSPSFSVEEGE